jgi:hypothetical protein
MDLLDRIVYIYTKPILLERQVINIPDYYTLNS